MKSRKAKDDQAAGQAQAAFPLGAQTWGFVGYDGEAFAPSERTYAMVSKACYATRADSGELLSAFGGALVNLAPLVLAATWEAGFALEAGALSTWSN